MANISSLDVKFSSAFSQNGKIWFPIYFIFHIRRSADVTMTARQKKTISTVMLGGSIAEKIVCKKGCVGNRARHDKNGTPI